MRGLKQILGGILTYLSNNTTKTTTPSSTMPSSEGNIVAPPESSVVMSKMHKYNDLFDGIPGKIMNATIKQTIDDLWDSEKLEIHRGEGVIQGYDEFITNVCRYLEEGLKTEFIILETHPKGLRYVAKAILPNNNNKEQQPMILDSIATIENDKIVKIEPAANSDIDKFLISTTTKE